MEYLIGFSLAIAVSLFARFVGLDRDRSFYPTVTIVVASYYGLFAIMGGDLMVLAREALPIAAFIVAAAVGFRGSPWIVAVALGGHGVFDFFHNDLLANPGMPAWWPGFCGTYDVTASLWLAWLLWSRRARSQPAVPDTAGRTDPAVL